MSRFDVERLTTDLENDPQLAEEISNLGSDPETWISWAKDKGYTLTLDEASGLSSSYAELSDDELENVAGGWDGG